MGDLYERLLARIAVGATRAKRRSAALRAVVELHKPVNYWPGMCCEECSDIEEDRPTYVSYPCSTTRAVARALDVEVSE